MFYINNRWLGGCLTNFKTIRKRIDRLNKLTQMEKVGEFNLLPKKEVAILKHEMEKLEANLGGIKEMRELPGVIFVVDSSKEHICVREARNLHIPVVGLIDTNCDPDGIDYVIPGNDDAIRSVKLIASALADAVIEAREGVSLNKETTEEDENFDLQAALNEVKPTVKETAEEKPAKKPRAKKVVKEEVKAEEVAPVATEEAVQEQAKEEAVEEKPAKKTRAKKAVKEEAEQAEEQNEQKGE